eukprot:1161604-Pelagomonas_calceolata.AAC.7
MWHMQGPGDSLHLPQALPRAQPAQPAEPPEPAPFPLLSTWALCNCCCKLFHMDILLAGEDQSQADQPNSLAEGPPV